MSWKCSVRIFWNTAFSLGMIESYVYSGVIFETSFAIWTLCMTISRQSTQAWKLLPSVAPNQTMAHYSYITTHKDQTWDISLLES